MSTVAEPKPKKPARAKEPKPRAKKPKAETIKIPRYVWDHKLECEKLAAEIVADTARFASMKDAAMAVKKSIGGKQDRLNQMIAKGPEHLPLIDGPKPELPGPTASAAPAVAANEAWRDVLLLDALCKPGTLTKPSDKELTRGVAALVKGKVETVGKLETLRATGIGGRKWWASIKGLTEEPAQKVEDAVLKWLSEHRDKAVLAEAREAGKPEAKKAGKKSKAK